ncbi:MAG TPA: ATP-binding protein [Acidobacteriota bacterium]|nr:ATP-binding protein [Acidobacteriota bacterium]
MFDKGNKLDRRLPALIILRAAVLPVWLNIAARLDLLPERFGPLPFLHFFTVLTLLLAVVYFAVWLTRCRLGLQLGLQIAVDLAMASLLVALTRGVESPFVSFFLLIIIYCSLALGRNGGYIGAALSTILYAGAIIVIHLGVFPLENAKMTDPLAVFRISIHALGFWAVAFLGACLYRSLRSVEKELKEKIESLARLRRLNEHIVGSIRSGLVTTDLDGCVAVFNAAAGELTGTDPRGMPGRPLQSVFGDDLWNRIKAADLLGNARALRYEQWIDLPCNARRCLGFSVSPLLDDGRRLLGYIVSFQDLTEITRLEEEVRVRDRMAAIGRMAAGIAHEIRNPLTAMRGSVEILRSRAGAPEKQERLLNILISESDRLNKFIEDFLDFARPKAAAKHPFDLVSALRDSVALLKNSPEVRDRCSVRLNAEAGTVGIFGSEDRVKQVFWNLAQNAIRAMPNGGNLTISIRRTPDGTGEVTFEDDGIGMSREEMEGIFQPFNSGFSGGHGLGLSIVFQIMEDHGGKIAVESEKGKGTRVILRFPRETIPAGQESAEEMPARLMAGG